MREGVVADVSESDIRVEVSRVSRVSRVGEEAPERVAGRRMAPPPRARARYARRGREGPAPPPVELELELEEKRAPRLVDLAAPRGKDRNDVRTVLLNMRL